MQFTKYCYVYTSTHSEMEQQSGMSHKTKHLQFARCCGQLIQTTVTDQGHFELKAGVGHNIQYSPPFPL